MVAVSTLASKNDPTCGMQTPGTLIIDGGQYEKSEYRSTSLAIVHNIKRRLSLRQRRVTQSYFLEQDSSPNNSPSELPSDSSNVFIDLWLDKLGFDRSEFMLLNENNGEELMKTAGALFIQSDSQSSLLDDYKYTQLNEEMWKLLERGGLIAGASVGAIAMGDFMPILSENQLYQHGFNFLPGVALDVRVDNRWDDLYGILKKNPSVLGIGITKKTAIVVQKHYFQVVETNRTNWSFEDKSRTKSFDPNAIVAVYSCNNDNDCNEEKSPYLKLKHRQWYDLCQRKIVTEKEVRQNLHASDEEVVHPFQTPYSFKSDYRLASQDFRCSGRRCEWLSSAIKIPEIGNNKVEVRESVDNILTELNLFTSIESIGNMEGNDFLSISYRMTLANNVFEGKWIELQRMNNKIGQSYNVYYIPVFAGTIIQIKLEAETSHENNEWYIVRDLKLEVTGSSSLSSIPSIIPSTSPTALPSLNPSEDPIFMISSSPTLSPTQKASSNPTINSDFLDIVDWSFQSPSSTYSSSLSKEPSTRPSEFLIKYVSNSPSIFTTLAKSNYPTMTLKAQYPTSREGVTNKIVTSAESKVLTDESKGQERMIGLLVGFIIVLLFLLSTYKKRRQVVVEVEVEVEPEVKDLNNDYNLPNEDYNRSRIRFFSDLSTIEEVLNESSSLTTNNDSFLEVYSFQSGDSDLENTETELIMERKNKTEGDKIDTWFFI